MFRLLATLIKEYKLLIKDKTGITILFIMPMLLVVMMTLIQNEAYKSINEKGIPVLLVNLDQDSLGAAIEKGFASNPICNLTVDHGENYPDITTVEKRVLQGDYLVALIIPKNATQTITEDVEAIMAQLINGDTLTTKEDIFEKINFTVITDPLARESFVLAMTSGIREVVASVKTKVLFKILSGKMLALMGNEQNINFPEDDFFVFEQHSAARNDGSYYEPNAVQHNVPAWAIFSIFFIVLPLAGSIINERTTGVALRMLTFPGSYLQILSGKILMYLIIAMLQFAIVLALGKFLFPTLGLPTLEIGSHWLTLLALTLSVSVSAVGYGFLIGTIFNTPQQSAIFGGISVLIMSALGGIWVPLNIMPETMQTIANISPLNWALKGYYELFIKMGGWQSVQWQVFKLCGFFMVCLLLSFYFYRTKRKLS